MVTIIYQGREMKMADANALAFLLRLRDQRRAVRLAYDLGDEKQDFVEQNQFSLGELINAMRNGKYQARIRQLEDELYMDAINALLETLNFEERKGNNE